MSPNRIKNSLIWRATSLNDHFASFSENRSFKTTEFHTMSTRRQWLKRATSTMGLIGVAVGTIPFVGSFLPSERAKAKGGPILVDVSNLDPGQQLTDVWRGKPIWILHRDNRVLENLSKPSLLSRLLDPDSVVKGQQPEYARNPFRSIHPEYFVTISLCTHLGCVPKVRREGDLSSPVNWKGGYYCPCHGSKFDFAGRVYKNVPAPSNLIVPPHRYLTDTVIEIGIHTTVES